MSGWGRRSGAFVKNKKKWGGGGSWGRVRGVRVDLNGAVKFFCENSKKSRGRGSGGGGGAIRG